MYRVNEKGQVLEIQGSVEFSIGKAKDFIKQGNYDNLEEILYIEPKKEEVTEV